MALSNNHKLFCQKYIELGMNATRAYMEVYKNCTDETARRNASKLLTNADIKEYIGQLQNKVEDKSIVKIEDVLKELYAIAFSDRSEIAKVESIPIEDDEGNVKYYRKQLDITDTNKLSKDAKKIVTGYKQNRTGISVETCDKMKALELIGKYLGMFNDSPTINTNIVNNPYANLSEEELRKLANE